MYIYANCSEINIGMWEASVGCRPSAAKDMGMGIPVPTNVIVGQFWLLQGTAVLAHSTVSQLFAMFSTSLHGVVTACWGKQYTWLHLDSWRETPDEDLEWWALVGMSAHPSLGCELTSLIAAATQPISRFQPLCPHVFLEIWFLPQHLVVFDIFALLVKISRKSGFPSLSPFPSTGSTVIVNLLQYNVSLRYPGRSEIPYLQ